MDEVSFTGCEYGESPGYEATRYLPGKTETRTDPPGRCGQRNIGRYGRPDGRSGCILPGRAS